MNRFWLLSTRVVCLLGIMGMMATSGCKSGSRSTKTLILTLRTDSVRWHVADFRVTPQTYEGRSSESGLYQVRLIDKDASVLARVGLGRLVMRQLNEKGTVRLALPYPDRAREVLIYRMDGSSGHYTLKEQQPLLRWKIPE